jgi:hypothetical protein
MCVNGCLCAESNDLVGFLRGVQRLFTAEHATATSKANNEAKTPCAMSRTESAVRMFDLLYLRDQKHFDPPEHKQALAFGTHLHSGPEQL